MIITLNARWESRRSHIFHRCERRLNASTVSSVEALDFTHTHPMGWVSTRMCVHACARRACVSGHGGEERESKRWKADGSSTRPSTVSNRIALLPANVCHVWHIRRAPRRTQPRCVWECGRTCTLLPLRRVHGVTYTIVTRREYRMSHCRVERTHDTNSDACRARHVSRVSNKRVSQDEKNQKGLPSEELNGELLAFILFRVISICNFGI